MMLVSSQNALISGISNGFLFLSSVGNLLCFENSYFSKNDPLAYFRKQYF